MNLEGDLSLRVCVPAPRIRGVGLLTGWGEGVQAFQGVRPDAGLGLVAVATPSLAGERFRRATRECRLAVAAVRAAIADAGLAEHALAGDRTGILYITATGYAAANRAFIEDEGSTTLHFPYTAPSAVPAEVTIELGIRGPYVTLMGGGTAALQGLWYAAHWLANAVADRVLLLAVEAVQEVLDLFVRARRLYAPPLVEGAACLLLEPGNHEPLRWASATTSRTQAASGVAAVLDAILAGRVPALVASGVTAPRRARAERLALAQRGVEVPEGSLAPFGEALACGPLIGLARARTRRLEGPCLMTAAWRDDYGAILWPSPRA
jgi:beta-ketoacyl synthase-like protein